MQLPQVLLPLEAMLSHKLNQLVADMGYNNCAYNVGVHHNELQNTLNGQLTISLPRQ